MLAMGSVIYNLFFDYTLRTVAIGTATLGWLVVR